MNACIKAVFAAILVAFCSIALIAVGQPITNTGGVSTQTVVNPSPLPDSLPIGNEQVVLNSTVTEKLLNGKPLETYTPIGIKYLGTNGVEGIRNTDLPSQRFNSYSDFEAEISKYGMSLVDKIKNDPKVDRSKPLSMFTYHMYNDKRLETPAVGIFLNKNLGLVSEINQETFLGLSIVARQIVIPITNLEKFEIEVDVGFDTPYKYVWTPQYSSQNITNIGSFKIPKETTTRKYITLQDWYSTGNYKARFKITAGGVTREYTQQGSQVLPPSVAMSGFSVNVEFTRGTETIIESSTDLKNWSDAWTIPWDSDTNFVSIPYYAGSGSVIAPRRFFRAKSQ